MNLIHALKKYGITLAAAVMVAVMLCDSPLMTMADDLPPAEKTEEVQDSSEEEPSGKEEAQDPEGSGQKESGKKEKSTSDQKESGKKDTDKTGSGQKKSDEKTSEEKDDTKASGDEGSSKDTGKEEPAQESESEETQAAETESEAAEETAEPESETGEAETASETESEQEESEVTESESSAEQEESIAESEEETETETETEEETEKAQNKGKSRKSKKNKKEKKESVKGSKKTSKKKKKSATEKKKTKSTLLEREEAESTLSSHLGGVAPWKGHKVNLPDLVVKQELRFKTIKDVTYKAADRKIQILEKMKRSARKVGYVKAGGQVTVLAQKDGWDYIECGALRGFVKDSALRDIDELDQIREEIIRKAVGRTKDADKIHRIEKEKKAEFAAPEVLTVKAVENEALTYKKITAVNTVIRKKYALVDTSNVIEAEAEKEEQNKKAVSVKIRETEEESSADTGSSMEEDGIHVTQAESVDIKEEASVKSRTVGTIKNGGLLFIIADEDQEWVFVESGDVRGFVESVYLDTGKKINKKVKKKGERKFKKARKKVDPLENKAFYYSLLTTVDKTAEQEFRETIIKAAAQCIGNPYVWGGTSLVNGADCSGFVQTLYRNYGISLPRVADDQSEVGTKVTLESAEAGDLIFFADSSGYVFHVAISTGDGGTIEARSERYGIVRVKDRSGAAWATDIISEMFED